MSEKHPIRASRERSNHVRLPISILLSIMMAFIASALVVACGPAPTTQPTTTAQATQENSQIAAPGQRDTATNAPPAIVTQELADTPTPAATTPTPTRAPTRALTGTTKPTPIVTAAPPTPQATTPTPTPGPPVTRTPAPPGQCPAPGDDLPAISPDAPGRTIVEIFEPQIRAYLDAGGSLEGLEATLGGLTLDDGTTTWLGRAQVLGTDVTGNETPDVVMDLSFYVPGQYAEGAILVYSCLEGRYEGGAVAEVGSVVMGADDRDPGIRAVADMNGDGVPEIVFPYVEVMGTHTNFTRVFRILEWDGGEFVDLIHNESYPSNGATAMNGDAEIRDDDGDGLLELALSNGIGHGYVDSGPQRYRVDLWAWDGRAFSLARSDFGPPAYRFQAVQDGDAASLRGEYDAAMAFYQQAISDDELRGWSQGQLWPDEAYAASPTPTPDPSERARLGAYAHYRIMLLHVMQGDRNEAQMTFRVLGDGYPAGNPGHPYAELATAFWTAYDPSIGLGSGCSGAVEYARAHAGEVLVPLGSSFYGTMQRDYAAEDICPFN